MIDRAPNPSIPQRESSAQARPNELLTMYLRTEKNRGRGKCRQPANQMALLLKRPRVRAAGELHRDGEGRGRGGGGSRVADDVHFVHAVPVHEAVEGPVEVVQERHDDAGLRAGAQLREAAEV